ncbi:hypothetical protein [Bacillus ndiopicus]|uniref:hypothetical protein n=1 Tax=Bacillus ndiopicus TaxID=1347368 RepID=UPI0005A8C728|nr:hypothetical protein [Bacillus ndiopicus]
MKEYVDAMKRSIDDKVNVGQLVTKVFVCPELYRYINESGEDFSYPVCTAGMGMALQGVRVEESVEICNFEII